MCQSNSSIRINVKIDSSVRIMDKTDRSVRINVKVLNIPSRYKSNPAETNWNNDTGIANALIVLMIDFVFR